MFFFRSNASIFGDRVFSVENGERRHVVDVTVLADYGHRWPVDVLEVDEKVILSLKNSGWLPKLNFESGIEGITSVSMMRDFLSQYLKGLVMEFGAGSSPFPTLPGTHVIYADKLPTNELRSVHYGVDEPVNVDLVLDVTNPQLVDGFLDSIVLCHVIEHLRNPILCLKNLYAKLKPGGALLLVVPDMTKTFDRARSLTDLAHIVEDFAGLTDRCIEHYFDFHNKVTGLNGTELLQKAHKEYQQKGDIHFHTFTYESFGALIKYVIINAIAPFSNVISHNSRGLESNEFYFILIK